ncbi:MAG: dihydroneopterin aldolase [Myxococcota bacterium]
MTDVILLEGLEVPAALGVSKAERSLRRPVRIELELEVDLRRSGQSDRLVHTIDYGEIYRTVEEVAGGREHRLVEALAERIAQVLLTRYPLEACTVTVRKHAPVAGNLRRAGVRVRRGKGHDQPDAGRPS